MEKKRRRIGMWIVGIVLLLLLLMALLGAFDMGLKTVGYALQEPSVEQPVRLALITDLHACRYGENQHKLLAAVQAQAPDAILLGGDIFDEDRRQDHAWTTVRALAAKYPCYYVTGNHEHRCEDLEQILQGLTDLGVQVLRGDWADLQVRGQCIRICGVDGAPSAGEQLGRLKSGLAAAAPADCTVLLAHLPEQIETYQSYGFSLVLSGHVHGGQWRIPGLVNGLFAPGQGFFPKYAGGLYELPGGRLIVSRGLARESTPLPRIWNPPELVMVELY